MSIQEPGTNSSSRRQPTKEFSFHRSPIEESTVRDHNSFSDSIKVSLNHLEKQVLIDICFDCFRENETLRAEQFKVRNQLVSCGAEMAELKTSLDKKRQNLRSLMDSHSKLTLMFQQHMRGCTREEITAESCWERKFKELNHYMNEYVQQNNEVYQEYVRAFNRLKGENERVYIEMETVKRRIKELEVQNITSQHRRVEATSKTSSGEETTASSRLENEALRKQVESFAQQKSTVQAEVALLLSQISEVRLSAASDLEELHIRNNSLVIQNQSLKAQLYLKHSHPSSLFPTQTSKANAIFIPPLAIHKTLPKPREFERSKSTSYI